MMPFMDKRHGGPPDLSCGQLRRTDPRIFPAPVKVRLTVLSGGTAVPLELPQLGVQLGQDLLSEVAALVGDAAVVAEET